MHFLNFNRHELSSALENDPMRGVKRLFAAVFTPNHNLQNQTNVSTFGISLPIETKHTLPNNHRTLLPYLCFNHLAEGIPTTLNHQKLIRLCLTEEGYA